MLLACGLYTSANAELLNPIIVVVFATVSTTAAEERYAAPTIRKRAHHCLYGRYAAPLMCKRAHLFRRAITYLSKVSIVILYICISQDLHSAADTVWLHIPLLFYVFPLEIYIIV